MAFACRHYCSFCKIALKTEKGWVSHLLSPDHQVEAREEFVSWDLQTKERVLVALGKFSVATETVLGYFVEPDGRSNLTGFVWNANRARVGLLLFESREKVDEILSGLGEGSQMKIGTYQLLQLKKATDYLDIEWDEHFVADFRKELKPNFMSKLANSSSDGSSSDSEEMELNEASLDRKTIKFEPDEMALSNLSSQLYFICREMEIEDEAYRMSLSIQEKFQRVLTIHYKRGHVFMFPHSQLRLRTQGSKELLFYVDVDGVLGGERGGEIGIFVKKRRKVLAKIFSSNIARKILTGISRAATENREFAVGSARHFEDTATKSSKFAVVTDPLFAVEAQTCRLLNYLLDFDPRARPFRTLIFYWAEQNGVNIQGCTMPSHLSYAFAPEPAGLEWMIILFLCRKRILPTPREILMGRQNNHHDVWYAVSKIQIDIGFRMDYLFAEVWRAASVTNCPVVGTDQFVLHLVRLSEEFFRFYGQLGSSSQQHCLNTKDGELLRKEDLLGRGEYRTRLTSEEQARFRNYKENLTKRHVQLNNLVNGRFTILHPLILEWTIPCDEDNFFAKVCVEMLASAKIIEHWLPVLDANRMDKDNDQKAALLTLFSKGYS